MFGSGNITAKPVLKQWDNGDVSTQVRVAVNSRVKIGEEWISAPVEYFTIVLRNGSARNAVESFDKGHRVNFGGNLSIRGYRKDDGTPGFVNEIKSGFVAHSVEFNTTVQNAPVAKTEAPAPEAGAMQAAIDAAVAAALSAAGVQAPAPEAEASEEVLGWSQA